MIEGKGCESPCQDKQNHFYSLHFPVTLPDVEDESSRIKGVVDCDFTFLTLVSILMLLFEHKQYLQSCGAESSMQTEISSFKILAV